MSNNKLINDILLEISQVDHQIFEENIKYRKSRSEILSLEKEIHGVKDLQSKALLILEITKSNQENTLAELKTLHGKGNTLNEYLKDYAQTTTENEIDNLKKRRDELASKLEEARSEMHDRARKLNDIEIEINIQKKKNAATTLRLQKTLQEYLQEEKKLTDQLRFM